VGKVLCLLSPQVLVNASLAITDLPFACLVALGLHAASRMLGDASWRRAAWAGLLLGAATLTRPGRQAAPVGAGAGRRGRDLEAGGATGARSGRWPCSS
jgi:hypothetical protein